MGHRKQVRDRQERLGALEVLRHCDRHELQALAAEAEERSFAEREVVCRTGEPAEEVYFVTDGHLGVVAGDQLVATLAPGAIAGELGPLGPAVRCADLVALTDVEAFAVPATALRRLLCDSPGLRKGVTPVLAERAEDNEGRIHA
jgi:CRP-like cAMP-binding protein